MVKNLADETLVKEALNIDSFRNLSKEKVIEFVSLIPNMDKDVAISIINQFPTFVDNAKTMIECLKTTCEDIISSNENSQTDVIESYKIILDTLNNILLNEDISFEEREYIIDQMISVVDKIAAKDSENKKFLAGMMKYIAGAALTALAISVTVLGVNAKCTKIPKLS